MKPCAPALPSKFSLEDLQVMKAILQQYSPDVGELAESSDAQAVLPARALTQPRLRPGVRS